MSPAPKDSFPPMSNPAPMTFDPTAVIFLDIDGVLLTEEERDRVDEAWPTLGLQKRCTRLLHTPRLALLQDLVTTTKATVVVSSSWRKTWGLDILRQMFRMVRFHGEIRDITPTVDENGEDSDDRTTQIMMWLRANPEVTRWVVIDDTQYGWGHPTFKDRTVMPDGSVGFTQENLDRAKEILR